MTADEWEAKKDAELAHEMARAEAEDDAQRRAAWGQMEATPEQLAYAQSLGVKLKKNATMLDASDAIDAALARPDSITNRQRMVLRFWGQDNPSNWGRKEVSAWMTAWYAGDWRRENEWKKFKQEQGMADSEQDFMRVPWNEGNRRLYPITSAPPPAQTEAAAGQDTPDAARGCFVAFLIAVAAIVFVAALATRK